MCVNALSRAIHISTEEDPMNYGTFPTGVNALSRAILISTLYGRRYREGRGHVSMPLVGRFLFLRC